MSMSNFFIPSKLLREINRVTTYDKVTDTLLQEHLQDEGETPKHNLSLGTLQIIVTVIWLWT